ncbi:cation diffusion facilitator family transporter [Brevundimonas sp. 2R-24]|uniref:Cation diffusion facilitator family transporter n=1 Tax=Peiella sedimenti TaxID=3061083 RepID=A0ABT8SMU3_9CAUL|nr:cation diffusion facilitator family transporter [Caulobacteraceae bacterium XZ-24]
MRLYLIGIGLNLTFVAAEFAAGLWAGSTALLADAGHNLSDVLSLALAGGAAWLAKQSASGRRTYGFGKATILASLANALLLVFVAGAVAVEALRRLSAPEAPEPGIVAAVAALGVVINLGTALMFMGAAKDDLNAKGAFLHMAADAAVSLGVVASAGLIAVSGAGWIDPLVGLVIVAVILWGTWGLLKDSLNLALDAAPAHIDMTALEVWLAEQPGVTGVHHLHVWSLSTTRTALTVHLVRPQGADRAFLAALSAGLKSRFGIDHATVQVEADAEDHCIDC